MDMWTRKALFRADVLFWRSQYLASQLNLGNGDSAPKIPLCSKENYFLVFSLSTLGGEMAWICGLEKHYFSKMYYFGDPNSLIVGWIQETEIWHRKFPRVRKKLTFQYFHCRPWEGETAWISGLQKYYFG